jgi:hypothetical protein
MAKLFSYVVDHDYGLAPNPEAGICTLVHCKFRNRRSRNIVELATRGDWIIGTGGAGRCSTGNGTIVYFMKVTSRIQFKKYLSNPKFTGRRDRFDAGWGNEIALVSSDFFYLGSNAISMEGLPEHLRERLAKKGRGFRKDYPAESLRSLIRWFRKTQRAGKNGEPVGPLWTQHDLDRERRKDCSQCKTSKRNDPRGSCTKCGGKKA